MNKAYRPIPIFQALCVFILAGLLIVPVSANVFYELQKNIYQTTGGATIYVDDDNVDGPWDGTLDHPYQYIQDGVDHALNGDTVYVFDGFYHENVVVHKSIALIGEERHVYLTGYGIGTVVKIIADHVTLTGFTIAHCGSNSNNAGIMIHTSNNKIMDNDIQYNDYYGLYVAAAGNLIYHNNFIKNKYQAFDVVAGSQWDNGYPFGGNYWDDYEGTDVNEDGIGETPYPTGNSSADHYPLIHPYGSVINTDTKEVFLSIQAAIDDADTKDGHRIMVWEGTYDEHLHIDKSLVLQGYLYHLSILDGRITGDVVTICADNVTVEGFRIQHGGRAEYNAGVIINGMNCSLENTIVYENFQGIILKPMVEKTFIAYNEITNNGWNGLSISSGCKWNHVLENTIAENYYAGVGISGATNNYLYHNNFKENRYQAYDDGTNVWDNGFPSGGNHWSDYTGSDENGDGFGDTPYLIPGGINKDFYPLMAPYTGGDTIPPMVKIQTPTAGVYVWGLHLFSGLLKNNIIVYGPIAIQVDASDAQSGISRVEFLVDDAVNPNFIDMKAPYSWTWSQPYLFMRKHTLIVIAFDNAGNSNFALLEMRKYL